MEEELLVEIRKAEESAKAAIEDAEHRKAGMVREAELEAEKLKEKKTEEFRKQMGEYVAKETEKIAKEASVVVRRAEEEEKKLKPQRVEEAKDFLKKEFDALLQRL